MEFNHERFKKEQMDEFFLFCKTYGLRFKYVNNRLPNADEVVFGFAEADMFTEAFELFHSLKSNVVYDGHIVRFFVDPLKGEDYATERFENYLRVKEELTEKLTIKLLSVVLVLIIVYFMLSLALSSNGPDIRPVLFYHAITWFCFPVVLYMGFYYLLRWFVKRQKLKDEMKVYKRIESLRIRLMELRAQEEVGS